MPFLTRNRGTVSRLHILAFAVPLLVLVFLCLLSGVWPFGDRCILHVDMYHQYAPFFFVLSDKLRSLGSPFFSWELGLGSDFVATYAYYLASPLNLLLLFWPRGGVIECMTLLVILKIAFSSLAMFLYLEHSGGRRHVAMLAPAFLYAFSGYFAAYYWDVMWLDCAALLPLVLLGEERILQGKKGTLYAVSLGLSVWSNYYIAYQVCLFIVLWFFVRLPELGKKGEKARAFFRVLVLSVLSSGISLVLLVPEFFVLRSSGSGVNTFPTEITAYYPLLQGLARGFVNLPSVTTQGKLPNLYCGVACIFFFLLFVLDKGIQLGRKLRRILLLAFFHFSFVCNVPDFIWHGFHFPEDLPARQSFLYIFVLLAVSWEGFRSLMSCTRWDVIFAGAASLLWPVLCLVLLPREVLPVAAALVSAALLLAYVLLSGVLRFGKGGARALSLIGLLLLTLFEGTMAFHVSGFSTTSRSAYLADVPATRTLLARQRELDPGFWRLEKYERRMKDENCLSGYYSASLFSSLVQKDTADAFHALGMEGGRNYHSYNGATPLTSALLQVKYFLSPNKVEEDPARLLVDEEEGLYLYRNKYFLPLGFVVDPGLAEAAIPEQFSAEGLNALARTFGATEDLLTPVGAIDPGEGGTSVRAEVDCYLYAEPRTQSVSRITVEKESGETVFSKTSHHYLLDLGWCRAGEVVTVRPTDGAGEIPLNLYRLSLTAASEAVSALSAEGMEVEEFSDGYVRGTVKADDDGLLAFGIPASDGWKVYVDGKEQEKKTFLDFCLAIPVEMGYHVIELKYYTPGFSIGAAGSLLSLVLLLGLGGIEMMRRSHGKDQKEGNGLLSGGRPGGPASGVPDRVGGDGGGDRYSDGDGSLDGGGGRDGSSGGPGSDRDGSFGGNGGDGGNGDGGPGGPGGGDAGPAL